MSVAENRSGPRRVVVAGALGIVGRSVVEELAGRPDTEVVGLSRRQPDFETRARSVSVDLTDPDDCRAKLADLGATDLVYCALHGRSSGNDTWGEDEEIKANARMLENTLDALEGPRLRHVAVLQGAKAYGCHLEPVPIPGKEQAPRHDHPNFYWAQEDLIRERAAASHWSWTVFRPQYIVGFSIGSPINILSPIGVYAAICRELGLPLSYPGRTATPTEATDARLLARAIAWSQDAAGARNEIFNVTNGDLFTFPSLLQTAAETFGMALGPDQPQSLQAWMADKGPIWSEIVRKHDLLPYTLDQLVGPSWAFADAAFSSPAPFFESTIKLRQAGFHDCIDSNTMVAEWLARLQQTRVLPR
ncbi:SDR family oxidoreductase [uncultured Phenylobacterium sp.]|uniref:SDR family oxidoreductase n=1 Tax=uncultured Phenylobacterium sp. TaxID=349273 RepID=UPI0025D64EA2|nr:SDR family oxidoreductase [uncultured Phenylobacterium sp.]